MNSMSGYDRDTSGTCVTHITETGESVCRHVGEGGEVLQHRKGPAHVAPHRPHRRPRPRHSPRVPRGYGLISTHAYNNRYNDAAGAREDHVGLSVAASLGAPRRDAACTSCSGGREGDAEKRCAPSSIGCPLPDGARRLPLRRRPSRRPNRSRTPATKAPRVRGKAAMTLKVRQDRQDGDRLAADPAAPTARLPGTCQVQKTSPARISSKGAFSGTISYEGLFTDRRDRARPTSAGSFNGRRASGHRPLRIPARSQAATARRPSRSPLPAPAKQVAAPRRRSARRSTIVASASSPGSSAYLPRGARRCPRAGTRR